MITVGIVGCGVMGKIHAECLQEISEVKTVATYDTDKRASDNLARSLDAKSCRSLEELLSVRVLDAVYVCTRHDSHQKMVEKAADAGKHIFCEKPMALTLEESQRIAQYVKEKKVHFMIGFNFRRAPIIGELRRVLKTKEEMPLVTNLTLSAPHFLEDWQGKTEQGGGIITCLGVHGFDLLPYLLQEEVAAVSCFAERLRLAEPYLEDSAVVLLELKDKRIASGVFHDYAPDTYTFLPEKNLLKLDLFTASEVISVVGFNRIEVYGQGHRETLVPSKSPAAETKDLLWSRGYVAQNRHFVESLLQDRSPHPGSDDGVKAAHITDAVRESSQRKRKIELSDSQI